LTTFVTINGKPLKPIVSELFNMIEKKTYYSIFPPTTAYARQCDLLWYAAIRYGKAHPDLWVGKKMTRGKIF